MRLPAGRAGLRLAPDVADALDGGGPVVALESTIVAHGLPRGRNLEVARQCEQVLRDAGVTPGTIAVLDGRPTIGLTATQLERIATSDDIAKASTRDLPAVMATGGDAATTVASTATLAHRAGIAVFATGGLGGVHRQAAASFDESGDLHALSRAPIAVVTAGVKSILDVPATLERLETLGITVLGYRTNRFPGFYVTDSGEPVDWRVDAPQQAADVLGAVRELGLTGAVVVANPLPADEQLDPAEHHAALDDALAAAEAEGLRGKAVTPFLLDRIQRTTGGASLEANIRAVLGNVALAGEIATAWSRRDRASA